MISPPQCPHNMANLGPLTAEIGWWVWGTPANFNGFRVLASLLHRRLSTEVNQTLHDVWPSPGTWCATVRRQHQLGLPTSPLLIDGCSITPVQSARDLDIYVYCDLSMRTHVQRTVSWCFAALRQTASLCTVGHTSDASGRSGAFAAGLWKRRAGQPSSWPDASTPVGSECGDPTDLPPEDPWRRNWCSHQSALVAGSGTNSVQAGCSGVQSSTPWVKKGCHPNHGYNVNSWSICKILSLLQRAVNVQQNPY